MRKTIPTFGQLALYCVLLAGGSTLAAAQGAGGHHGHHAQEGHHSAMQGAAAHHGEGHHHGTVGTAADAGQFSRLPASSTVSVDQCWVRFLPSPTPSGGYFVVHNAGSQPVALVAAASTDFGEVMLHQTTHSDGMSRMSMVDTVAVSPGTSLQFKPGGYHAMLEKPLPDVKVGSLINMVFKLDDGHHASARCEVKPAATVN